VADYDGDGDLDITAVVSQEKANPNHGRADVMLQRLG
jgi:hypothetical protein